MREKNETKFRNVVRWLILCGLLSGIFFSSGEGLRLLPFPISPAAEQGRIKGYTPSVHGASGTHAASKLQKINPGAGLPVKNYLPAIDPGDSIPTPEAGPDFDNVRRVPHVFLKGQSNRAPPLV